MKTFVRDAQAISNLSPEQYRVTQQSHTERPGSGAYLGNKEPGIYVDIVSGEPLFASSDKFDSGSGWPSFDRAKEAGTIIEHTDRTLGMARTEIVCARCGGHLGHVFPDGPTDTGLRYCVNSLSLTY